MNSQIHNKDLSNRAEIARFAVVKGAEEALKFCKINRVVTTKEGKLNFATEADIASNKIIIDLIQKNFPQDNILSEETITEIRNPLKVKRLWVIDPIDGTLNFQRQRKYSAVSVGYVENGIPLIGAICDIFHNDLYYAQKGKGAECNGVKIHVSDVDSIRKAVFATAIGSDQHFSEKNLSVIRKLPVLPWIIMNGSAVLQYCEVARGSVDLYFQNGVKPWDNAAAHVLITEAGGVFYNFEGNEAPFTANTMVVGNKKLVKTLISFIEKP